MKKAIALLLTLTMLFVVCACSATAEQARVMTSFYPIYIFALNVFDGIEEISVECMTAPQTGCLHDYQLLVSDMMKLSDSQALIVCGAGMETYLTDVQQQFPALPVIDCSQGIELLCDEDGHEHGEHEEGSHAVNAHTWLDVQNAILIVRTIEENGCALFPEHSDQIHKNADAYVLRLEALDAEITQQLAPLKGHKIVTFHEAFPYFARAYGLEIAAVISQAHEEALSPMELMEVIKAVETAGNPPLFTEPQYSSSAAEAVAAETGATIYELDPLVNGDIALDAYETGMRKNAETLVSALK